MKGGLQFEPISYDNTENIESKLNGDELATACVLSSLSCPDRDNGV